MNVCARTEAEIGKDFERHIIPAFQPTFREMMATWCPKCAGDVTIRFCGIGRRRYDAWRELRRLFWQGGRNLGKSLVVCKPLVPHKTEQQKKADRLKFVWFEELSDFNGSNKNKEVK